MVRERYPRFGEHALAIKEVNTPELYPWLRALFPTGKVILLVRDPFDTLDSYLDLQRPGSWNDRFGDGRDPLAEANVERTAAHIAHSLTTGFETFESWPLEQRLRIDYEELLGDPTKALEACCNLVAASPDAVAVARVVEKHDFRNYRKTGKLEFRRQGRAGGWRTSDNFTPETRRIANRLLGPLRQRLGYQ